MLYHLAHASVKTAVDTQKWVRVLLRQVVQLPIFDTETRASVLLLGDDDVRGPAATLRFHDLVGQHLLQRRVDDLTSCDRLLSLSLTAWQVVTCVNTMLNDAGAPELEFVTRQHVLVLLEQCRQLESVTRQD